MKSKQSLSVLYFLLKLSILLEWGFYAPEILRVGFFMDFPKSVGFSMLVFFTVVFYVSWLVSQLALCRHSAAWAYASAWTTSPKLQGLETCCFFKKIPYLSRMKNCSRHANLSVRLFARDITRGVPPPKVWKFQHLITIFSVTIAGISLISCIYVLGQR